MKSVFDEDCDKLRAKLRRLEKRRLDGKGATETIPVSVDLLEMLVAEHDDLLKIRPRR